MTGNFIVGIGGSGSGFEAARKAADLAAAIGASLIMVFGYETSALGPRGGPLEERITEVGEEAIGIICEELASTHPNLVVEVSFVAQRPADALISVAAEHPNSVIAVGHGGQGPLRAALLGNVTYEIVHRSTVPVLVVPDDKDDEIVGSP